MHDIITTWKQSLGRLLHLYESRRGGLVLFVCKIFSFFVVLNISCYWWGMFTAFPDLTYGREGVHYFKVQFPVGFLGALFDSLSFFVTVYIIRRALRSHRGVVYVAHLLLDLLIAVLATFWVLFVFSFSGWLISLFDVQPQALAARHEQYEQLLIEAVARPADNMRNIYFGLIMGISASVPTCIHIAMLLRSSWRILWRRRRG